MLLHIVSIGLNQRQTMQQCLDLVTPDDAILFIEDGVYWATGAPEAKALLQSASCNSKIYVLNEDVAARGIQSHIAADITCVDYVGFVTLTEEFERSASWY